MSIIRWGDLGSHVYIIGIGDDDDGKPIWQCVGCCLGDGDHAPKDSTTSDLTVFFNHLKQHREAGDTVPHEVEERLLSYPD